MCANLEDLNSLYTLTRREIEAKIVAPILKEFEHEFGKNNARHITHHVIMQLAEASGRVLAMGAPSNDLIAISDLF
jgi:hypothetical protein